MMFPSSVMDARYAGPGLWKKKSPHSFLIVSRCPIYNLMLVGRFFHRIDAYGELVQAEDIESLSRS